MNSRGWSCLLLAIAACGSSSTDENGSSGPLLPASSGWKRIATVSPATPLGNDHEPYAIAPHELSVDGTAVRVIYSVQTLIPPVDQTDSPYLTTDFKAITVEDSPTPPTVTPITIANTRPNENIIATTRRPIFRAGSDVFETLLFYRNAGDQFGNLVDYDEAGTQITVEHPSFDASLSSKMLANGDILAGDVNFSAVGELDHYDRAANTWTFINQSAGDNQWLIAYTPFVLASGATLAFRLYSEGDQAFLSIADFVPGASFPAAPYAARFIEAHPEYARSGVNGVMPTYASTTTVGAYVTDGQTVTVVLPTQDNATKQYTLSAYSWTEGETTFRTLYHAVAISTALGDLLVKQRDRVDCRIDGTVYAIVNDAQTYKVVEATASGETSFGEVSAMSDGDAYGPTLSQLRYLDGAYYAVVGLILGTRTYDGAYLDVVKLVP
ncbi:MAG TPA: hypothetical protein VGM90_41455 [Kofleriaceae bacterium]|jgi:hypothetical protein